MMIQQLLSWLGGSAAPQPIETTIDRFMSGESIPSISAPAGQGIISRQRDIEGEIRAYIGAQDAYITRLEQQVTQLQAERNKRG